MKNKQLSPMLLATIIFSVLMIGFFCGRMSTEKSKSFLSATSSSSTINSLSDPKSPDDFKININTATADDLMLLPGIGPALAERIITYRETNGAFSAKEDLINVKGIGTQTYSNLEQFITTGG